MQFRIDEPLFHRKMIRQGPGGGLKVYVDFEARTFEELDPKDLLDTADLCRLFGTSTRSVYRWMAEFSLTPTTKAGREYLFTKRDIVRWYHANRPRLGRPPLKRR